MTDFAAVIDVTTLDGTTGTTFVGASGNAGFSVAFADVNGDGIADLIVGAPNTGQLGFSTGTAYVIFGKSSGWGVSTSLGTIGGANGFTIGGQDFFNSLGFSVASAGDVNGDGVTDFLLGAPDAGTQTGAGYLVMGHTGGWGSSFNLNSLNGANGGVLGASATYSYNGFSVSGAGDLNGDGFGDVIVGVPHRNHAGPGAAYVVFGKAGGVGSLLFSTALNGTNGFNIAGVSAFDYLGWSVSGAGDVNNDGKADLIVGAPIGGPNQNGAAYVIFGGATLGASGSFDVTSLNGSNGFRVLGPNFSRSGSSVAGIGDINGDHIADIAISGSGVSYVVFGSSGGFASTINITSLNGSNGFGITAGGNRVASAGDVNGDGIGDLIVSTPIPSPGQPGDSYVIFGRSGGFGVTLDVSTLDGTNGFKIAGAGNSIAAGDFNGDGFSDLAVGFYNAVDGGIAKGAAYIIFGHASSITSAGTGGDDVTSGGAGGDSLSGGDGNDTLNGLAGIDVLNGGIGDDVMNGGTGADAMTGGTGDDTFYVDDAGDATNENSGEGYDTIRSTLNWTLAANIEALILDGSGDTNGTGNGDANSLTGNSGANTLNGAGGNDIIYAGDGFDSLIGGAGKDILYGQAGDDTLSGGTEGDWLDGGLGTDAMTGGTGDDTYVVDDASDTTIELSGEGNDVVRTFINWTLGDNIERLILDGSGSITGTGNGLDNLMVGNSGDNLLEGGGGNDTLKGGLGGDALYGGDGDDILYGGDGSDLAQGDAGNDVLNGDAGNDVIYAGTGNDTLNGGDGNDFLIADAGNDQLNGGAGVDGLYGREGNDVMDGGAGPDTMSGELGDDIYYVDDPGDTTIEAAGEGNDIVHTVINWTLAANTETLVLDGVGDINGTGNSLVNNLNGNGGANTLDGAVGDDVIKGFNGNDVLIGGTGSDILVGGAGADTFLVRQESVRQSHLGGTLEIDTVNDLTTAQGDKIDLSAIDADSSTAGDQAFHLVAGFTSHAGEMVLGFSGGITTLSLDVDGDGTADYRMKITGDVHLDSGGWVL
ncbi:Ca2+-binding RTX toxin-like protein [Caulobacter ginsengisoli]|uniref:Ca2+-binding RTX toxin-like protein n=1 Tax=Caulobacter ginsengisoli TaxID=400775 RepID=A0ABU0IPM8_9CAUL|nr:hypothetical protein [Caulobacter ginsengisoli]MDQ0463380.1 Ca2+-binding RTX toxin-like protein [Caulobacter ginsengisoli]